MLPNSLQSIYEQYKSDTNLVANWLATTAKAHGYERGSAHSNGGANNPPARSSRLEGKARK